MPLIRVKRTRSFVLALLAVLGLVWMSPASAPAQNTTTGTITGQVTDAQGKAIVGAVILLTNNATQGATPTVSNAAGRFAFVNLQPGNYSVDVKKDGFKEAVLKSQDVTVGKQLTLNIPMQVGESTQTVEVTATGAELQTMNATVGSSISGDAIMMLPNLSRDANSLTNLQPNTAPDGGVAGADSDQNSFTLDGGVNSDDMDGSHADYTGTQGGSTSGTIPTPAASIEQFSVGVSNQSADVNSAAGSSVAMVTKRGTDTLHGSAYDYYLGSYLAANSWSNNRSGTARPKQHQNRFGAALGGEILPNWLGGKTYLFGNFEGRRYPQEAHYTRSTPTATLRQGIIAVDNGLKGQGTEAVCGSQGADPVCKDASGAVSFYNLNTSAVTVGGVTYNPAVCNLPGGGTGACDPRALGMNPVVKQLWSQFLPNPNKTTGGDNFNTLDYTSGIDTSLYSNFFVVRADHDFGAKNHFDFTYHFFSYNPISTAQVDIGGGTPGNTFGQAKANTVRPQLPSMWTATLTTNVNPNVTNHFNFSYLRNFWQWSGSYLKPQAVKGYNLGGALEIGGETSGALIPYNVNTQNVRSRYWDGIGITFKDDLTWVKGNHLIQFGARYTHQRDMHQRNDNGGGIMAANVYQIGGNGQSIANPYIPVGFDANNGDLGGFDSYYNEVMGIVDQAQTLYTRAGQQLTLQPLGTPMFDNSTIPMYNFYYSDAWHIRPSLTLTYGTGYTIEMPPHEELGKQVELVDQAGNLVGANDYLAATQRAALSGQAYTPEVGFATVANVGAGLKYPYRPFWGGLSPRVSLAWNPNITDGFLGTLMGGNKTVIRGGWSRIFGRLNGVDLVLVPLLGTGLGQPVACLGANNGAANSAGVAPTSACNGNGGADPMNAFRIGVDGSSAPLGAAPTTTLAQPYFPGIAGAAAAGAGETLDPNFRPNRSDEFDLTIQRQITPAFSTEFGYTGRKITNEYQAINLDNVPYMMTAGGQQFQNAFASLWKQINAGATTFTAQPFFENALGGSTSAFCTGFTNCTSAVVAAYGPKGTSGHYINTGRGNDVYSLWTSLDGLSSWTLGRTFMSSPTATSGAGQLQAVFLNGDYGYGNYNSLFWTVSMRNWHGLTASSNFTWSRAFGTGQVDQATSEYTVTDPYNMHAMYGPQYNDTPLNYNLFVVWSPGSKEQTSFFDHLAHGWSFAPIVTWNNGGWQDVNIGGDCASFGETDCNAGGAQETAVLTGKYTGGDGYMRNVTNTGVGTSSNFTSGGTGMNRFGSNAAAVYSEFRPIVLGMDTTGQAGLIPGLNRWSADMSVTKNLAISERFSAELNAQATNIFNTFEPSVSSLDFNNQRNFGRITGSAIGARSVEVGFTVRW
jgi:hypothetical protein